MCWLSPSPPAATTAGAPRADALDTRLPSRPGIGPALAPDATGSAGYYWTRISFDLGLPGSAGYGQSLKTAARHPPDHYAKITKDQG
jgi:hypothetical protein